MRQPPGKPPAPRTVSVAEPGGDAHDPHEAALLRQLNEPWGRRNDRDDQVHVPTPDWEHWKRVRYWGVEHFAGWRYGDDHHVIALLFVHDVPPGETNDSASCLKRFDAWASPQVRAYEVQLEPGGMKRDKWRDQPIVIKWIDGHVDLGFRRRFFSAAWTALPRVPRHVPDLRDGRAVGRTGGAGEESPRPLGGGRFLAPDPDLDRKAGAQVAAQNVAATWATT